MLKNHGNYIISLGELTRWLAIEAESLGCDIYPGFPGKEVLINQRGFVEGIATADMGLDKQGNPKEGQFQRGIEIKANQTLIAEGARGSLTEQLKAHFGLN